MVGLVRWKWEEVNGLTGAGWTGACTNAGWTGACTNAGCTVQGAVLPGAGLTVVQGGLVYDSDAALALDVRCMLLGCTPYGTWWCTDISLLSAWTRLELSLSKGERWQSQHLLWSL